MGKLVIQFGSAIKTPTMPASIVDNEDTWLETVSIMAEDEVTIEDEAEVLVGEAEVEDELVLEEREVKMVSWLRRQRKKKPLQQQMVRWAKLNSKSRLMECWWTLTLITELSLLVGNTT